MQSKILFSTFSYLNMDLSCVFKEPCLLYYYFLSVYHNMENLFLVVAQFQGEFS